MKNIHLQKTDKPSRLFKDQDSIYNLHGIGVNQHIYLTSEEDIKDCWVLNTHTNQVYFLKGFYGIQPITKKIILTTDTELISDGVQAIPDEFLEWFVKNPSCEEVEVKRGYLGMGRFVETNEPLSKDKIEYKIIIPKEEPKQEYEYIGECRGNNGNDVFKELAEWLLINKRSVFMDADISKESKKKIMNDLGYSSNSLDG